jgi:hypothetical protein
MADTPSLAHLQAECMDAPPLAAWSDWRQAQSLIVDSSGHVFLSGHCQAHWLAREPQLHGIEKVSIPIGLAAAIPNVRSVACSGESTRSPIVLTQDGQVVTVERGTKAQVSQGTVKAVAAADGAIVAASDEGGLY